MAIFPPPITIIEYINLTPSLKSISRLPYLLLLLFTWFHLITLISSKAFSPLRNLFINFIPRNMMILCPQPNEPFGALTVKIMVSIRASHVCWKGIGWLPCRWTREEHLVVFHGETDELLKKKKNEQNQRRMCLLKVGAAASVYYNHNIHSPYVYIYLWSANCMRRKVQREI